MQRVGGCAVGRQGYLIAVVGTFLIGCAVLLVVGFSGVQAEASQEEQGHTEATEQEQGHSGEAAPEEDRCKATRTIYDNTTNDVPGCPKGGLLSGTNRRDKLDGEDGDDEIRGLGGDDEVLWGGSGSDVIYGGPGDDSLEGGTYWHEGDTYWIRRHEGSKYVHYGGPGS